MKEVKTFFKRLQYSLLFHVFCYAVFFMLLFSGTKHRVQQVADVKEVFSNLKPEIPLLTISGNHDVGNIPNNQTIDEYRREFGDEYYSFWVQGVFFIAINSQCFFNCSETQELCAEQSAWLEQQLQRLVFASLLIASFSFCNVLNISFKKIA